MQRKCIPGHTYPSPTFSFNTLSKVTPTLLDYKVLDMSGGIPTFKMSTGIRY